MEDIRKIAESIVDGLSNLDNRTNIVQKIAYSYRDLQIEIVLNHLRQLTSQSSGMTGKMKIAVGEAYHWNKAYLEGDLRGKRFGDFDLHSMLLRTMVKLIKALSEKSYDDPYAFKAPMILKGLGFMDRYDGGEREARYIDRRLFGLLRGLDRLIRLALKRSYQNGKKDGANLLIRLASGDITIEKFQKEVEREVK